MREILFRAKRIDNGEWVSGYYVYDYAHNAHFIFKNQLVCPNCINDRRIDYSVCDYEIDPDTLCQYTGLKDKNGNRIWENDIVSCEHEKYPEDNTLEAYPLFPEPIKYTRNYAVEFINTGSRYGYRLRNKSIHFMLTENVIQNHKIEVVGNIFDNPELLKGERGCRN